jgi:hypothetical protein
MRVADRNDELTDAQSLGVSQLRRVQLAPVGAEEGEIGERVRAHDVELELTAVHERRPPTARACHHVRGGQHETVGRDHDGAAAATPDAQVGDGGRKPLRNRDHRLRVRVQRLVLSHVGDERQLHAATLATARTAASDLRKSARWPRSRRAWTARS